MKEGFGAPALFEQGARSVWNAKQVTTLCVVGAGQVGQVVSEYFSVFRSKEYSEIIFVEDDSFFEERKVLGRKVLPMSLAIERFSGNAWFVAIPPIQRNMPRQRVFHYLETHDVEITSFIHPRAEVSPSANLGKNVLILENVVVQTLSSVGNNSFLWSGAHIGHHANVGDHCFISTGAVVAGGSSIGDNSFLGINCSVTESVTTGEAAIVSAGALVGQDLPNFGFARSSQ